jgi:Tol biopolymer transport system component
MGRHTNRLASVLLAFAPVLVIAEPASSEEGVNQSAEWITFVSHRSGHNLLYKMRPDGAETESFFGGVIRDVPVIAEGVVLYRQPHWTRLSPHRKHFASWVYELGEPYSAWQGPLRPMLVVGDLEGTWTRVVNPDCHEEFAWSPDSKRLAFSVFAGKGQQGNLPTSLRIAQIVTCGIDGSNEKVAIEQPGILIVLDWSLDGKRLLLSRRYFDIRPERSCDLFELELATSRCLPYLIEGSRDVSVQDARYSPRGDTIAVIFTDPKKQYAPNECAKDELDTSRMMRVLGKLAVLDRDGKNMRTIADYPDGMRGPMCWSPDGTSILVSRYLPKGDNREQTDKDAEHGLAIWAVRVDGKGERFLTTGWSPDWR